MWQYQASQERLPQYLEKLEKKGQKEKQAKKGVNLVQCKADLEQELARRGVASNNDDTASASSW